MDFEGWLMVLERIWFSLNYCVLVGNHPKKHEFLNGLMKNSTSQKRDRSLGNPQKSSNKKYSKHIFPS